VQKEKISSHTKNKTMKIRTKHMLIILLAVIACFTYGQAPLRQVTYTTTTSRVFAVPKGMNIEEEVSTYDLTKMTSIDKNQKTDISIDQNHKTVITTWFLETPRYTYDYEFGVGSSITSETGTRIYDHEGQLLNEILHDIPDPGFQIEPDMVPDFGLVHLFTQSPDQWQTAMELLDYTVSLSPDGSELIAVNDSMEIRINPSRLTFETRLFRDSLMEYSDWNKYQNVDGKIIPLVSVLTTYDLLENHKRFQQSEITRYNSYYILNHTGDTVVSWFSNTVAAARKGDIQIARFEEQVIKNGALKAYPNPAADELNVSIPAFIGATVDLEILSLQGSLIRRMENLSTNAVHTVDISNLQPGGYILRCGKDGRWKSVRFVKN